MADEAPLARERRRREESLADPRVQAAQEIFGAEVLGRPLQLRMFPPAELARGPLTVTIRGRANRQQLTTISTNDANAIAVALPADWLAPGDYAVTLQPVQNGLEPAGQPALFGFTVRAPTAR